MPAALRLSEGLGAGRPMREHPVCTLTAAEVSHLRRLVAWVDCDAGQEPDAMVDTVRAICERLGDVSEEGKARLVASHAQASNAPRYVRAAIKALRKTLAAQPAMFEDATEVEQPVLPAPNAKVSGVQPLD
jgi:hypothetical protein